MPNQLNYTVQNIPIEVTASGIWGEKDVPDVVNSGWDAIGDGIPDNGQIPLVMLITPTNTQTHTVCVHDFTIGGTFPENIEIESGPNEVSPDGVAGNTITTNSYVATWYAGQEGLILPEGVVAVIMRDSPTYGSFAQQDASCPCYGCQIGIQYNSVVLTAYVDPLYPMPDAGELALIIDIDGDAKEICNEEGNSNDNSEGVEIVNNISILIEMISRWRDLNQDGIPSFEAAESLYAEGEGYSGSTEYLAEWTQNSGTIVVPYIWDYNEQMTSNNVNCWKPVDWTYTSNSAWNEEQPSLGDFDCYIKYRREAGQPVDAQLMYPGSDGEYKPLMFFILPRPGYVVSRHMFKPAQVYNEESTIVTTNSVEQGGSRNWGSQSNLMEYCTYQLPTQGSFPIVSEFETSSSNAIYGTSQYFTAPLSGTNPPYSWSSNPTYASSNSASYPLGTGISGLPATDNIIFPPASMTFGDYYPATRWSNVNVTLYTQDVDGTINPSVVTWSSLFPGITASNSSLGTGDIIFIDTVSPNPTGSSITSGYGVYGPGYNFGTLGEMYTGTTLPNFILGSFSGWSFPDILPTGVCPSDFEGNAVLLGLNNLEKFIPANHGMPLALHLRIAGAAVQNNGDECVDVDIDIEIE